MDLKKDGVDPMIPFAVVIKGADKVLKAFAGDTPEYANKMFENTITEEKPDFLVFASDSYLTIDGIKYDAVLLKAYDRKDSEIYIVGQRFKPKTDKEDFEQIGNPAFLETVVNSFNSVRSSSYKRAWWKFW